MISWTLKYVVTYCGPNLVFTAKDVSTSSICAGGDMKLLYSSIGSDTIKLIGCWRSDRMLHYLYFRQSPSHATFPPPW